MSVIIDSVMPTVATASAPRCATKKTSATAKTDSMAISTTMGIARSRMARPRSPSVKSCRLPRSASLTEAQNPGAAGANAVAPACAGEVAVRFIQVLGVAPNARGRSS
jgi:hypothetical protein